MIKKKIKDDAAQNAFSLLLKCTSLIEIKVAEVNYLYQSSSLILTHFQV